MNLKNSMLSEISHKQKNKDYIVYLHVIPRIVRLMRQSTTVVIKDWGLGENGDSLFKGYGVSVWEDENVLEMGGDDGSTTM